MANNIMANNIMANNIMAVDQECIKDVERRGKLGAVCGWIAPRVFAPEDIVCGEWAIGFSSHIPRGRIRAVPQDLLADIQELVHEIAAKLVEDIVARVETFVPTLNPTLQSALLTLKTAKNLTASELIALNSVLGGASIRNKFDVEAFYAKEDEVSR